MEKPILSFSEEQIQYIQRITKVSKGDLLKTIRIAKVSLEEIAKYLKTKELHLAPKEYIII